jgi:hypothetical protein
MADSSSSESNPVVMEEENTWKIPVVSNDIGPDKWMDTKLNRQLQEHYALKQPINIFPMPYHPSFGRDLSRMLTGQKLILHPFDWLKLDFSMTVS